MSGYWDPRHSTGARSTQTHGPSSADPSYLVREESPWVVWVQFASVMLILLGSFHAIEGLVGLFRDEVFATGRGGLVVDASYTTWGWAHIIWGVVAILVGASLLAGRMWARIAGVFVAFVSAIVNVGFLPAYPVWSVMMIGLDVLIIWAIMVHGGELRRPRIDQD
jgi:hypothetical protein